QLPGVAEGGVERRQRGAFPGRDGGRPSHPAEAVAGAVDGDDTVGAGRRKPDLVGERGLREETAAWRVGGCRGFEGVGEQGDDASFRIDEEEAEIPGGLRQGEANLEGFAFVVVAVDAKADRLDG